MTKLTIQLDGKTYKTKPHTQGESTVAYTIETLIGKGYLVELQPQEEKTEQSILSKLRAEIESRRDEYRNKKSTKRTSKMTENDKILEIRANEMDIVLLLLNELEKTQPSQPEEWSPRPQEWIEVCHDEEDIDWIKARFIQKDSAGYYCEYENAGELEQDYFDNARPLSQPQPIEPEFDWDWVMKQLEENQENNLIPFTALAIMATHLGVVTKYLRENKPQPIEKNIYTERIKKSQNIPERIEILADLVAEVGVQLMSAIRSSNRENK